MSQKKSTRRDFIKRAGYAAPVILTLGAKPSFASAGSSRCDDSSQDCAPKHEVPGWLKNLIKKIIARIRGR